ncbi:uroporphyrinogen-III synthase [Nocardioides marmoriginsengisoli]|uniref:Uroporphyrinogen-III synthase n=1 Tax=Nocardioides marmoriginsengisoli TaxID=661483 RepID=A0A3N0CIK8_9ACTN|nr:uroporphyrinogen-III synthase [Nocardioides marmoriginsengisoli]RNL63265.1 uroporphyrinogen-III synthase [Nocardioides marmoriginsengisoli]
MTELTPVLAGTRILVTAQRRSDELAAALTRRGADVTVAPALGVVPSIDEETLLRRAREIIADPADTFVVTTGIGFRGLMDACETAGLYEALLANLESTRLVARGPKARGALQAVGLKADWVAESETSAEIVEFLLAEGVQGQRIAVQHHGAGDPHLEAMLVGGGAEIVPLEVYRWGPPADPAAVTDTALAVAAGGFDAVMFTSAPAAIAWLAELAEQGITEIVGDLVRSQRLLLAAVGPVTAEPLVNAGLLPVHPDRSRMGALVRLVILTLGDEAHSVPTPAGVLHVRAAAATLDHEVLALSPNGLAILRRLALHPGEVVSRDRLLEVLPGESSDPHTAEVAVARLRESLSPHPLVRTVIKRGYVLQTV